MSAAGRFGCFVLAAALAAGPAARGGPQAAAGEIPVQGPPAPEAPPAARFHADFQAGFFYNLSGRVAREDGAKQLLTAELTGSRWDGRSTAWGLGLRGGADDLGARFGPELLVRFPLGRGGKAHLRAAATAWLAAGGDVLADQPGWGLEVAIAPGPSVAFAVGWERLKYRACGAAAGPAAPAWCSSTESYAGVKLGRTAGLVMAVVALSFVATFSALESMDLGAH